LFYCDLQEKMRRMDWNRAIEINRLALTRIVGELFAMLGVVSGLALGRMLRPAESAVRRLIVIAAHGLVAKPIASRPMPKGLVIASKSTRRKSFQLFDTRKVFGFITPQNPLIVMVKTYTRNPFNPFDQIYWRQVPKTTNPAVNLSRRLDALKHALETIPQQAIRLVRWQAKREGQSNSNFTSPLRPGRPPGYRAKPKLEIDYILKECHGLAWDIGYRNST
jgi:hypothetical protein